MLLTDLLFIACLAFLLIPSRITCQGWHCLQWAGLLWFSQQSRKCHTNLPKGQSDGGMFSIEVPLLLDDSSFCQVEKKLTNTLMNELTKECSYKARHSSYPLTFQMFRRLKQENPFRASWNYIMRSCASKYCT